MARSEKNLTAVFTDTASAIRAKTGTTETICPLDFADKINAIETGGGGGLKAYFEGGGKCGYSSAITFDGIINYSDTENVEFGSHFFAECENLKTMPNIDYSSFKDASYMFYHCRNLESIDININATNMSQFCPFCFSLKTANVHNNATSPVSMQGMFRENSVLDSVRIECPWAYDMESVCGSSHVSNVSLPLLINQDYLPSSQRHNIYYDSAFRNCGSLYSVSMDIGGVSENSTDIYVSMKHAFFGTKRGDGKYCGVSFANGDKNVIRRFDGAFANSSIAFLGAVNCAKATGLDSAFTGATSLKSLEFYNISTDINISDCTRMERSDLLVVLNNLATVTSTKTCTLGATNLAKLTDDDKAIATNKGWTLA